MISVLVIIGLISMYYGYKVSNNVGDQITFLELCIISSLGAFMAALEIANFILYYTTRIYITAYVGIRVTDKEDEDLQ